MAQVLSDETTRTSDIDQAIDLGLGALSDAGIQFKETPFFLVVGLWEEEESSFQEFSLIGSRIRVTDNLLPVHWYGDENALWMTLPGISSVSMQARELYRKPLSKPRPIYPPYMSGDAGDLSQTMSADRFGDTESSDDMHSKLAGSGELFETFVGKIDKQRLGLAAGIEKVGRKEIEARRLQVSYLAQRLREIRHPVLPINGILFHIPFLGLTGSGIEGLSAAARADMETLQNELGLKCLCLTVFSGIERSPEFTEYINRLDRRQVRRRCGCSFLELVHLEPRDTERAHSWLVSYFETQIFSLFRQDMHNSGNFELFRLLDDLRRSKQNFVKLLTSAFPAELEDPFYFGGVYFGGTERIGHVERPFLEGVLARLIKEHEDSLSWAGWIRRKDQENRKWGWVVLLLAILLAAAGIFFAIASLLQLGS